MKRNGLLFILAVLAVFSFSTAFAEEKQINPQNLVGEWQGSWETLQFGSGRFYLDIKARRR